MGIKDMRQWKRYDQTFEADGKTFTSSFYLPPDHDEAKKLLSRMQMSIELGQPAEPFVGLGCINKDMAGGD